MNLSVIAKGLKELAEGDAGAQDDERLRVFLVLDLAETGGAVGVRELEGLKVVEVEAAALGSEGEVAGGRGDGLA